MADAPDSAVTNGTDFLNHLTATLNRCSGRWKFIEPFPFWDLHSGVAHVQFLNTGRRYQIDFLSLRSRGCFWRADEHTGEPCSRLTGLLNGHVRNDAGVLS